MTNRQQQQLVGSAEEAVANLKARTAADPQSAETALSALRPTDIDLFDQRIEANAQRPSLAGWEALARDLRAALPASTESGSRLDGQGTGFAGAPSTLDVETLRQALANTAVVVMSDYNKGAEETVSPHTPRLVYEGTAERIAAEYERLAPLQALRAEGSASSSSSEPEAPGLREAVIDWWENHRPVEWTEEEHRANPTVNTASTADAALAEVAAALAAPGGQPAGTTNP